MFRLVKALFITSSIKLNKSKLSHTAFSFALLFLMSFAIFCLQNKVYAQALCTNGGGTCPSSTDPCFKVSSGAGTDCAIHVSGTCINFYSSSSPTGGTGCQNNVRQCPCIDLNVGFTFSADLFFGSNLTSGVGDGLAFVLRAGDQAGVGGSGGNIGYSGMAGTWVGVEFDDHQNLVTDAWGTDDPACQHSGIYRNGSTAALGGPTCLGVADVRNTSNTTYGTTIAWNPVAKTLAVSFNGSLLYTATIDLVAIFGASATCVKYSLSTGTGGLRQNHRVCNPSLVVDLPVSLLNFTGELVNSNQVLLNWQTSQEINNKEFSILRSSDSKSWETIAVIQGAGNSSSLQNYFYTDRISVKEDKTIYYKLKQIDFDGQSETFNVIAINPLDQYKFEIIPNPSKGQFKLVFGKNVTAESVAYKIYNMQGKEVFPESVEISENDILVNGSNLPEGMYFINVIHNDVYIMNKLIIN